MAQIVSLKQKTALGGAVCALVLAGVSFVYAQTTLPAPAVLSPAEGAEVSSPTGFSGTGFPNSTLFIDTNLVVATTSVGSDGHWGLTVALPSGTTATVGLHVFDANENTSATTTHTVVVSGESINPPTVNTPTDGFEITGTADPGATVQLQTPSGASCRTTAGNDGSYSCTFDRSPEDGESIIATAFNALGESSPPTNIPSAIRLAPDTERSFLREGLFGCEGGGHALPTGTLQAIADIYVPVNDAAVTLNTGYLVYKECVLDGVVVAMREAASAAIVKSAVNFINTGAGGNPLYPTNREQYLLQHTDEVTLEFLDQYNIGNICAPYKEQVRVALAREYTRQTRDPASALRCSIGLQPSDQEEFLKGDFAKGGFRGLIDLVTNPRNNPYGAYLVAQDKLSEAQYRREQERRQLLLEGNGLIPVEEVREVPTNTGETRLERHILTPGFLISRQLEQAAGSGFRQLESASEVDQIINALFSGIGNQILTDIRGFQGLSEPRRGRPPYIEQLSSEASARVRQSATNTALTALTSSLTVENNYNELKKEILTTLEEAAQDLRDTEERCWTLIEEAVEDRAEDRCVETREVTSGITGETTTRCVRREDIPFTVATSTQFSNAAIEDHLQALTDIAEEDVRTSDNAIGLLQRLINDVRNTESQTIQRIALEKLDTLIANHAIHTAFDIKDAQQQRTNVSETVPATVEEVITDWGSGNGWCNVENSSVVETWLDAWRTDE